MPFLQAEADLQNAFVEAKMKENEAIFMKDVKGWEPGASVYKTRYMDVMKIFGINH